MKVLVACESSERVKKAFLDRGHEAHSCDLKPGEQGLPNHHQCDIFELLREFRGYFDMLIGHPDCTYLANSGAHWLHRQEGRWEKMVKAAKFFKQFLYVDISFIAIENPIPHRYAIKIIGRKYDQIIQPYNFGEDASKATCFWLKGLPKLKPTKFIEPHYRCPCGGYPFEYALGKYGCPNCLGEHIAKAVWSNQTPSGQNHEPPGEHQKENRSRTYQGIANAMAEQWG